MIAFDKLWSVLLIPCLAFAVGGCGGEADDGASGASADGGAGNGGKVVLQVEGSDTMVNLAQAWAERYSEKNSGVQVQMFSALGAGAPAFAHLSLLTGAQGGKLSKRVGSMGVDELREQGFEAGAVTSFLARIGTSQPVVPVPDLNILAKDFDFSSFGRAAARFDPEELAHLNAKLVHMLPYDQVADRLPQGMNEAAWSVLRPNLNTVSDAADWWQVVTGPLTMAPQPAERDFLIAARDALNDLGWDDDIWKRWTADVKGRTGRKGKTLFQPLRLALTGREQGPDMSALLPLIGREAALQRLEEAAGPEGRSAA